jgi:hypothetical protein
MNLTPRLLLGFSLSLALAPGAQPAASSSVGATSGLRYSTYLGGKGDDFGGGIAVDAGGTTYVAGGTTSDDFPTVHAWQAKRHGNDVFVAKFGLSGRLLYSTYLGGSGSQYANGIAVDSHGNAYLAGLNNSPSFPAPRGHIHNPEPCPEAFLAELNSAGKLVFSTGMQLSSDVGGYCYTEATGVAVDAKGIVFVTGNTQNGTRLESFVERLNLKTHRGYNIRIPGTTSNSIAVDSKGNAFITGAAAAKTFTPVNALQPSYGGGLQDAFVAKLDPSGKIVFNTYLGGNGEETGRGIAVDETGSVYVTGDMSSTDFPTVGGLQTRHVGGTCRPGEVLSRCTDAFVTKLSADGHALIYSTYLGGSDNDGANSIAVDVKGNAFLTGFTSSRDFPTVQAVQSASGGGMCAYSTTNPFPCNDAFVAELNAQGSKLVYSTYLGGPDEDVGEGIAVDRRDRAHVTGFTRSRQFPTVKARQRTYGGGADDGFVTVLARHST